MNARENQSWDRHRFDRQRDLALNAKDATRLARVYLTATQAAPADERSALFRQALLDLQPLGDSDLARLDIEIELVKLNPTDTTLFDRVSAKLRAFDKTRELAALLESLLHAGLELNPEEQQHRRLELFDLYFGTLNDRARAVEHMVRLLEHTSVDRTLVSKAEELVQNRSWLKLLAPNLARVYECQRQATEELSLLTRELDVARGARLTEVRKRLAILRQDFLDDADGALEALEPLVSSDPADDEMRRRFLQLSILQGKRPEAARRLTRAMISVHDQGARARIGLDLGRFWEQAEDISAATSAYIDVLRTRANDPGILAAAEALGGLSASLNPEVERERLWALSRMASAPETRRAAAETLLNLTDASEDDLRTAAYETLLATADDRALESLLALESLYTMKRDFRNLISVLERLLAQEHDAESSYRLLLASRRAERLAQLGSLRRDILGDERGAFAAFNEAISIDSRQATAVDGLLEWMNNGPLRLEAALVLEPHLRNRESYAELVVALGARAEFDESAIHRLAAATEALELFERKLVSTESAAWFCAQGLKAALDTEEEKVSAWTQALERYCAGNPSVEADGLLTALGERSIENSVLFSLAIHAAYRLVEAQKFEQASNLIAKAQSFDPCEPGLLALADVLSQVNGDTPDQRLQRIEAAISADSGSRRVGLLTVRASIERSALGPCERELATWMQIIAEDPSSTPAHQALCELYRFFERYTDLEAELRRAVPYLPYESGLRARWQLATLLATTDRTTEATDLFREVLGSEYVDAEGLARATALAKRTGDLALERLVLERRVRSATSPLEQADANEALGDFMLNRETRPELALTHLRAALTEYFLQGESQRVRALGERILSIAPNDSETAVILVFHCFNDGDFETASAYFDTVAQSAPARASGLLSELEPIAIKAGKLPELLAWLDRLMWQDTVPRQLDSRLLVLQKARWLGALNSGPREANESWRALIESYNDERDIAAYGDYLMSLGDPELQREGRRWLYERRVSSSVNPTEALLDWAITEADEFGDKGAALTLCERALVSDPQNASVLQRLTALRLESGCVDAALDALEKWHRTADSVERESIDLRIVELLFERLDRAEEALEKLEALLHDHPSNDSAIQLSARLADTGKLGARVVALFEHFVAAWEREDVAPKVVFDRIRLVIKHAQASSPLWNKLESLSSDIDDGIDLVVASYTDAISHFDTADVLEPLGERLVSFSEQWAPDPSAFTTALLRVLQVNPKARWALDRVTIVLSQQGRFSELLDRFDRAIAVEQSEEARHGLLDEAVVTARDLAKDYERAISYLERQCLERPNDAKAQASLERLYRRGGYTRKLIDLLTRRLESLVDPERAQVEAHIAARWLELGAPDRALEVTENVLERRPHDTGALELLERIVDSSPGDDLGSASSAAEVRAARRLCSYYVSQEKYAEAIRVLESQLRLTLTDAERATALHELADLRANRAGDFRGAFEALTELVSIEPQSSRYRQDLEELATRLGTHREHAEALVGIAFDSPPDRTIALLLLSDALRIYGTQLNDPKRESQLYEQMLQWAHEEPMVLHTLSALEKLYAQLDDPANLCRVLECKAEREPSVDAQVNSWRAAARLSQSKLSNTERAVTNWQHVLEVVPADLEAIDGLIENLTPAGDSAALVDALEQRAGLTDGTAARDDLVRAARVSVGLGNSTRALTLWQRVANRFGDDRESALAIADLLEHEERWPELRDHLHEYSQSIENPEKREILMRVAALELQKMQDALAAVTSYSKARAWAESLVVVESTAALIDRVRLSQGLIDLADAAWKAGDNDAQAISYQATLVYARCALPSPETMHDTTLDLAQSAKLIRRVTQTRDRLLSASQKPYIPEHCRSLVLESARITASLLREPLEAIRLYAGLFEGDPTDPIADQSFLEYSELLRNQHRWSELAELYEIRAQAAPDGSPRAIAAWLKAGEIWDSNVSDLARAFTAYRYAADSDSVPALEAVARLARQLGNVGEAARALERLVDHAGKLASIERVIELVDAYLASGDLGRARMRLETALHSSFCPEVDLRLENLYRRAQQWPELVELLKLRADRRVDATERVLLLREIAELERSQLLVPAAAASTLARALAIQPDSSEIQLELARTCAAAGQYEEAVSHLQQLISVFGPRRTRARAELHTELSSVLSALGQTERAFEELRHAASIDQTHPRVLYELGKSALVHEALDLAEQSLSSLLLLLHRAGGEAQGIGQVHAYLVLSEVATRRGDALRAKDYIESAFETALESPEHERRLLTALVDLDKPALVQRALELRWTHVTDAVERASLLRDRLQLPIAREELAATRERLERRARETYSRLGSSSPARAYRDMSEVFEWLSDSTAAHLALGAFAERVDWAKADPSDATALLRLAHRELSEGVDLDLAHRHLEAALRLGVEFSDLERTLNLVVTATQRPTDPPLSQDIAGEICKSLADAIAAAARSVVPSVGADLLLKIIELAEWLGQEEVAEQSLAIVMALDPNRRVLLTKLRRLRVHSPDGAERWQITEQLLAEETGSSAIELAMEIAQNARHRKERARAARALSRVVDNVQAGSTLSLQIVELLAWAGLPQRAMDLVQSSSIAWLEDDSNIERVTSAIHDGVHNLEQEDRLSVELQWIDWLASHHHNALALDSLTTLATEMGESPSVLERLSRIAAEEGRAEQAILAQLQRIKHSSSTDRLACVCELYDICAKFDRLEIVRSELEQAWRDSPNDPEVARRLTLLYERLGAHVELAQILVASASSDGNAELSADSLVRAARLVRTGDPNRALEYLERSEHLFPNVPAELELARHHASRGYRQRAIELYSLITVNTDVRYSQERTSANLELAQLHLSVDQLVEAHEALTAAFRFRAKNSAIAWEVAALAIDLGDEDGAKRALRVLVNLKSGPEDGDDCVTPQTKSKAYYYLGRMSSSHGDPTSARRMLIRALEEDSTNALARKLQERLAER